MSIQFIKYRKIYFIISGILILGSLACLAVFGLRPGIDFTGGSILEVEYQTERPDNQAVRESLVDLDLGEVSVQSADEKGVILRMEDISEDVHQQVLEKLKTVGDFEEKRFESIGPVIGRELEEKTKVVVILSILAILLYIAIAFGKVSRPVSSWQYGIASIFMLLHDILIPLGILAVLGNFYGIQITIPIVTALLTIIGYAINNVVVVYDRIRENILRGRGLNFEEIADNAINQTFFRQINTSLTTLFPLTAIFLVGGETLKYFALTLILGIAAGTYSSIFLASPILVAWLALRRR